jgi:hypothetical protein
MTDPADAFILLICEGPSDPRVAKGFAERVLVEHEDLLWLRQAPVEAFIPWRGLTENTVYLKWSDVPRLYGDDRTMPEYIGGFGEQTPNHMAKAASRALRLAQKSNPTAIVLVCDGDEKYEERKAGLEQAREKHATTTNACPVVIGVANRCREAWVLAGFDPRDDRERALLKSLRDKLSFDPIREPHKLQEKNEGEPRSPKNALRKLLNHDSEREHPSWEETPLETLKQNGEACGLKAYLEEVETKLVPIYDPRKGQ